MRLAECWNEHLEEGGVTLELFICISLGYVRRTPKGKRFSSDALRDFLFEGIQVTIESMPPENRPGPSAPRFEAEFCARSFREFLRVLAREYARLVRRVMHIPTTGLELDGLMSSLVFEFRQQFRQRQLLEIVALLPVEMQQVIYATLLSWEHQGTNVQAWRFATTVLGIGKTTYYLRWNEAISQLRHLAENSGRF